MEKLASSCDVTLPVGQGPSGSRVLRLGANQRWEGVSVSDYQAPADRFRGVARMVLVGDGGEKTAFHLRYIEIAPGGFSSLEKHVHEHAVVVLRGRGQVRLGETIHELGYGDVVYVAPHEVHQFRNPAPAEPFGFLCVVDAQRDQPVPWEG